MVGFARGIAVEFERNQLGVDNVEGVVLESLPDQEVRHGDAHLVRAEDFRRGVVVGAAVAALGARAPTW